MGLHIGTIRQALVALVDDMVWVELAHGERMVWTIQYSSTEYHRHKMQQNWRIVQVLEEKHFLGCGKAVHSKS